MNQFYHIYHSYHFYHCYPSITWPDRPLYRFHHYFITFAVPATSIVPLYHMYNLIISTTVLLLPLGQFHHFYRVLSHLPPLQHHTNSQRERPKDEKQLCRERTGLGHQGFDVTLQLFNETVRLRVLPLLLLRLLHQNNQSQQPDQSHHITWSTSSLTLHFHHLRHVYSDDTVSNK